MGVGGPRSHLLVQARLQGGHPEEWRRARVGLESRSTVRRSRTSRREASAEEPYNERMRGIEPPLRAWEARVLPLNYIRRRRPSYSCGRRWDAAVHRSLGLVGIERGPLARQQAEPAPQGDEDTDAEQPPRPGAVQVSLGSLGTPTSGVRHQGGDVAHHHGGADRQHELGEQSVEPEQVGDVQGSPPSSTGMTDVGISATEPFAALRHQPDGQATPAGEPRSPSVTSHSRPPRYPV